MECLDTIGFLWGLTLVIEQVYRGCMGSTGDWLTITRYTMSSYFKPGISPPPNTGK